MITTDEYFLLSSKTIKAVVVDMDSKENVPLKACT